MLLTEKEMTVLKDLQTQEKSCVDKYERYAGLAKDEELKQLFGELKKKEQEHYKTISGMLMVMCHPVIAMIRQERTISRKVIIQRVKPQRIKLMTVFLLQIV